MMPLDSADLMKARDRLRSGGVVAIPTETVYGLAASIDSDQGLKKIFSLKERPFFDPLIVHVSSLKQAQSVAREWPPLADFIARWFWPGPLTIVLPKAEHVNSVITSGLDTVAIRFPSHPLAKDLIDLVGTPLAAPSANKFGRTSPSTAEHVRTEFADEDLLILDGGPSDVGVESTVISFHGSDEIRILRPGAVTKEDLEAALGRTSHSARVVSAESSASPGHLKHHYMPKVPLVIVETVPDEKTIKKIAKDLSLKNIGNARELTLPDEAEQAARVLYAEMRRLSDEGADLLWVVASASRTGGLWTAIWDRLTRAASWNLGSVEKPESAQKSPEKHE
ncbi:MAG: L-threonylcarbamoyladenylate synthase [Bdellovibrionota bacterium]